MCHHNFFLTWLFLFFLGCHHVSTCISFKSTEIGTVLWYRAEMFPETALKEECPHGHVVGKSEIMFLAPSICFIRKLNQKNCVAHLWSVAGTYFREFGITRVEWIHIVSSYDSCRCALGLASRASSTFFNPLYDGECLFLVSCPVFLCSGKATSVEFQCLLMLDLVLCFPFNYSRFDSFPELVRRVG